MSVRLAQPGVSVTQSDGQEQTSKGGVLVTLSMTYTPDAPPTDSDFSGLKIALPKAGRVFLGAGALRNQTKSRGSLKTSWSSSTGAATSNTTPNCQMFLYNDLMILTKHKKTLRGRWSIQSILFLDDFVSVTFFPPQGFSICDQNHKQARTSYFSACSKEACSAWLILLNKTLASKPSASAMPDASSSSPSSPPSSSSSQLSSFRASLALSLPPAPPPPTDEFNVGVLLTPKGQRQSEKTAIEAGLRSTDFDVSMEAAARVIDRAEEALSRLQADFQPNGAASPARERPTGPGAVPTREQLVRMKGGRPSNKPSDAEAEVLKNAYDAAINLWQSSRQVRLLAERGAQQPAPASPTPPKRSAAPRPRSHGARRSKVDNSKDKDKDNKARQLMRQDTSAAVRLMKELGASASSSAGPSLSEQAGTNERHPAFGTLYEVLYAYSPRRKFVKKAHSLQVGDIVMMIRPLNDDWALGRFEGRRALFPLRFTRLFGPKPPSELDAVEQAPPPVAARAFSMPNSPIEAPPGLPPPAWIPASSIPVVRDPRKLTSSDPPVIAVRQSTIIQELTNNRPRELSFMIDVDGLNLAFLQDDVTEEQTIAAMESLLSMTDSTPLRSVSSLEVVPSPIVPEAEAPVSIGDEIGTGNDEEDEDEPEEPEEEEEPIDEEEEEEEAEEITDPDLKEIRAFEKETREIASWLELEMRRKSQHPKSLQNARTFADILRAKSIPFLEKFVSHPDAVPIIVLIHEALSRFDRDIDGAEERVGLATSRYDLRRLVQTGQPLEKNARLAKSHDNDDSSSESSYSDSCSDDYDDLGDFGGGGLYSDL